MRTAITSDIHANLVALEAVLADIDAQRVDRIVCLGGTLGYGAHPVECLDLIRTRCAIVLAGSQDFEVFSADAPGYFNGLIQKHIKWVRSLLEPTFMGGRSQRERWDWLGSLTNRFEEQTIIYTYGSPRDACSIASEGTFEPAHILGDDFASNEMGYTYKIRNAFEAMHFLCFIGNTHRPGIGTSQCWIRARDPFVHKLDPAQKTIVNVGSVGQPRDCDPRACYVVFDTTQQTVEFRKIPYDIARAQAAFRKVSFIHSMWWERLTKGV